jgi:hypothetical protein
LIALLPAGILERRPKLLRWLVIDPHCRLPAQNAFLRPRDFVVVGLTWRDGRVRQRPHLQDIQPGLVETVGRDSSKHSAIAEACCLIVGIARTRQKWVLNKWIEVAVVVDALREVPPPFELCGHPEADDVVAAGAGLEFLRIKEEEFVVAAGFPDWTADREPPVALLRHRFRIAVQLVDLAVAVPAGIAFDVVYRAAKSVRAAFCDCGDLQPARSSVLRLKVRREYFDFGDRFDVHLKDRGTIGARIDGADSVHHHERGSASADADHAVYARCERGE